MGGTWGEELLLSEWQNVIPSKCPPSLLFGLLHFDWSRMHPHGLFPWSLHFSTFSSSLPNPWAPLPTSHAGHVYQTGSIYRRYINMVDMSSILGDKSVKIQKKNLENSRKCCRPTFSPMYRYLADISLIYS